MAAANAGFGSAVAVATGAASYEHLCGHSQFKPDFVMRSINELPGLLERLRDNGKF